VSTYSLVFGLKLIKVISERCCHTTLCKNAEQATFLTQDMGTTEKIEAVCDNIPRIWWHGTVDGTIPLLFRVYSESCRYCNLGSDGESLRSMVQMSRPRCICASSLYKMSANCSVVSKILIILLLYEMLYQVTASAVSHLTIHQLISGRLADFIQHFWRRRS
jgi:hypothetical protein